MRTVKGCGGRAGEGDLQGQGWRRQHSRKEAGKEKMGYLRGWCLRVWMRGQQEGRSWLRNEGCKSNEHCRQKSSRGDGESPASCGALFLMWSMAIGPVPAVWECSSV